MMARQERTPATRCSWSMCVRTNAHLDPWLADVLSPLALQHEVEGTSLLRGNLADLAAVYGLLLKLRDTGISLVSLSIQREEYSKEENDA